MTPLFEVEIKEINSFAGQYSFLSNFYPAPVFIDGVEAKTVEHAYQAAKTLDISYRRMILSCSTPAAAKRLGKTIPLRANWEKLRLEIMKELIVQKFTPLEMGKKLLSTGKLKLVEGNWWRDTYWGVDNLSGQGENHLGIILMEVREALRV